VNLVFDVGNTETTIGLFERGTIKGHWRIMTEVPRTPDEFGVLLRALLAGDGFEAALVHGVAIGSVVPPITNPLREACGRLLPGVRVVVIDAQTRLPITLDVEEPLTVGADRVINTLAASRLHHRDAIVVDLGTATTFDCITKDGVFLGGIIAPGVRTSAETLFRRTSKLPATELEPPLHVIGKRTEECIRAGVMYGAADSIDGLVGRLKSAWPSAEVPMVIATGGLATAFRDLCKSFDVVDPFLTLSGLDMAYELIVS
jgi:type III pantothenate kinase